MRINVFDPQLVSLGSHKNTSFFLNVHIGSLVVVVSSSLLRGFSVLTVIIESIMGFYSFKKCNGILSRNFQRGKLLRLRLANIH